MKKSQFVFLLSLLLAVPVFAQESRQDISVSGSMLNAPFASGSGVQVHATPGYGGLISYRYLLTPHGGLELNYQYAQDVERFCCSFGSYMIHTRFQEFSGAYVYSFNFRNWNPFIEAGPAGFTFSPIDDSKTQNDFSSRSTSVGLMYGAGFAYEISPSFDIRAEYRGLVMKTPNFNVTDYRTNVYYNIYDPVVGIAYHF